MKSSGKVYLAGAGPGDPGLITLKTMEVLKRADIVLYDHLVNPSLLKFCPQAHVLSAGKISSSGGNPSSALLHKHGVDQERINRRMVHYAHQGKTVVRLKGGDPFIFGRGGEEASYLKQQGIPFEVIPGVSAGQGAPAYAGIPVTDRRYASSVTFVTCHEDPSKQKSRMNWSALAGLEGTLVFFMGVSNLAAVLEALQKAGKPERTPACIIERGTWPRQKVIEGTLGTLAGMALRAGLRPPAVTVIGDVVRLRSKLAWFEKQPLFGRKILVTRPEAQAGTLCAALREKGADIFEWAAIRIVPPKSYGPLDRCIRKLKDFDSIIFTSTNAVDFFFGRVEALGRDARLFGGIFIAAMGEATARRLNEKGLKADLIPKSFHSEQLVRELKQQNRIKGRHFLLPRTDIAPVYLKDALESNGARVTQVLAYRTFSNSRARKQLTDLLETVPVDAVLFASASSVEQFFHQLPERLCAKISQRLVSIGPVTSAALREQGYCPKLEARKHTIKGLVEVLVDEKRKKRKGKRQRERKDGKKNRNKKKTKA